MSGRTGEKEVRDRRMRTKEDRGGMMRMGKTKKARMARKRVRMVSWRRLEDAEKEGRKDGHWAGKACKGTSCLIKRIHIHA